eukprot:CAMPEP_0180141524 /NCGR_PEP_ID=MMETSP0986-20121125/14962_1 /TAXON_ID=697907 /ORGANISM="non described non described, Strain CCMP2293" /LENGTH=277 /DNA_ID=CAMNT_0022084399 /DNA_START=8 /DNA_END=841 /DNA_ORIENTATION=+
MPKAVNLKAKSGKRSERLDENAPYKSAVPGAKIASTLEDASPEEVLAMGMIAPADLERKQRKGMKAAAAAEELEGDGGVYEKPSYDALTLAEMGGGKSEYRRVPVPAHRFTPLKEKWLELYDPIVSRMKLQVRMNLKNKSVELRTSEHTEHVSALQKSADFLKAFLLGFEIQDAIALLRLDDLYVDTFEVKDVKPLHGDHLSRAIGRIAGKAGKTKFAIENATRTRIVVADSKIHLLGSFSNIKIARDAICDLILGSAPGKVYTKLRAISSRLKERF